MDKINKMIHYTNKSMKTTELIDDNSKLQENLELLKDTDSDDSLDRRMKKERREEVIRNYKPYRITYS